MKLNFWRKNKNRPRGISRNSCPSHPLIRIRRYAREDQTGQVLVIGAIVAVGLAMVAISTANVGMMVAERIQLQDTVDAATYSAATVEARYMNLSAYINRTIIANYNAMAFNTGLWAVTDAYDHGSAITIATLYYLASILQIIPFLQGAAAALDSFANGLDQTVHNFFHSTNDFLDGWFDQTESDINNYIEIYNTEILSTIQGINYAAIQSARYQVAKQVAEKMDPEVLTTSVMGLGTESINSYELSQTVDWVIKDTDDRNSGIKELNDAFNRVTGTDEDEDDHELLLAATTEASLDKFAAGRDRGGQPNFIRSMNLANILPSGVETAIETFLYIACIDDCIADWLTFSECDCDPDVSAVLGTSMRWGQEDDFSQDHVPVIARRRMREVNMFGLDISMGDFLADMLWGTRWGHTSGEKKADIANYANLYDPIDWDPERAFKCLINPGQCTYNKPNIEISVYTLGFVGSLCALVSGDGFVDDHWDGSYDPQVACAARWYGFGANICWGDLFEYISEVCSEGLEEGVPRYDWETDLPNVGFPHYIFKDDESEERPENNTRGGSFVGPSVSVYGVKKQEDINGLQGLGIGNEYDMRAYARGQVYYLRNPNRPNEKPSMFNPHWVARLAPIDEKDTPDVVEKGLGWLGSWGLPMDPTH